VHLVRRPDGRIVGTGEPGEAHFGSSGHAEPDAGLVDVDQEWLTGVWCLRSSLVGPALRRIPADAGLVPLHRIVEVLAGTGHRVEALALDEPIESLHVTDRLELAQAEAELRRRTNHAWMARGVTMVDPSRTYIDTTVVLAPDVTLFPGVMLQGDTRVGPGAAIGPDTRLQDCAVGAEARVEMTMARDADIGPGAHVGPFAVLDPGASVAPGDRTGPFFHGRAD
jgi:bifunctional UDP-N-acetylglucosamine pyrophosphorylase/glucosamine-1-phosphate N-acetyltransferase